MTDAEVEALDVALVAEAPLVGEALARWLQMLVHPCRVSRFASASDAAARIGAGVGFDLVVIGDFLNAGDGEHLVSAVRQVCGAGASCPVVVVSAAADLPLQRELLGCGARAHIPTSMPANTAAEAVQMVLAGGTYAPPPAPPRTDAAAEALAGQKLTPRECQVLGLLERGYPNRRIAAELGISENTVMVHLRHLMRKLGATNRTQAVFKAHRLRAVPAP